MRKVLGVLELLGQVIVLKVLISASTLALVVFLVLKYFLQVKLYVLKNTLPPSSRLWNTPPLLFRLFMEVLICLPHIPPGVNFTVDMRLLNYRTGDASSSDQYTLVR